LSTSKSKPQPEPGSDKAVLPTDPSNAHIPPVPLNADYGFDVFG
jgi:hypothetical protein